MKRHTVIAWLAAELGLAQRQRALQAAIRFATTPGATQSFEEWGAAKELWRAEHVSLLREAFFRLM